MRDRPRGRVSLVLPDDAEGLPAPVVAHESDGAAELHDPSARIGHHELRADTSRVPVANVSRRFGESFSIAARLSVSVRALRGDKLRVDLRQSGSRDIVRARRDWPVRDIADESIFVYESSAHTEQVGTLRPVASAVERPRLVLRPQSSHDPAVTVVANYQSNFSFAPSVAAVMIAGMPIARAASAKAKSSNMGLPLQLFRSNSNAPDREHRAPSLWGVI
jgi:hypothetical protein